MFLGNPISRIATPPMSDPGSTTGSVLGGGKSRVLPEEPYTGAPAFLDAMKGEFSQVLLVLGSRLQGSGFDLALCRLLQNTCRCR